MNDLRHAFRSLAKSPGFTTVAVLSLALGIGANTAVFSVAKAVLLQALPVKAPEQLVLFNWLSEKNVLPPKANGWPLDVPGTDKITHTSFSIPTFEAFQRQAGPLADVFAFAPTGELTVKIDGTTEVVPVGQFVSDQYHHGLGVIAAAGRLFQAGDNAPGAEPIAVISHRYWQRRFGGDVSALGKTITINGISATIVGVTAPAFNGTLQVGEVADLTLPLTLEDRLSRRATGQNRLPDYWWVRIMGRLKPGATLAQARAGLATVFRDTARGNVGSVALPGAPAFAADKLPLPQLRAESGGRGLYEARRGYERSLQLLMAIVGLVLLVACANVANLLLARGASRRREIAVRLALGASRARIVRQLLAESVLLSGIGAAVGLVFSLWGTSALLALQPFGAGAIQLDTTVDGRVLAFTAVVALGTGVIFGLAPALRSTRLDLTREFQGGGRTLGTGARSILAKSLMVVQVALSLVLLVAAGLFVGTLRHLQNADLGFNGGQLLLFKTDVSASGATVPQALALYDRLQERLTALHGVRRASYAFLSQETWNYFVNVPGYISTGRDLARMNAVSPDYFSTLELPLLRGRDFSPRDTATAPAVTIVNQSFARKYFGTEDVVGRHFTNSAQGGETEIVGLMPDALYSNAKSTVSPAAFLPYAQFAFRGSRVANFAVRFVGAGGAVATAIRTAVHDIDPALPVTDVRTQQQQLGRVFASERLFASLSSVFGALALLLVAVGLYGLMSYTVLRRTSEIGVRLALGALPGHVLRMILRESLALVSIGVALGLAAAWTASRLVASMLFGLSATDPLIYGAVALLLIAVSIVAALLPAHRATKVDPLIALRAD